ncbi:MAG: hypothetical protein QF847_01650 [Candidatus Marinimicrobia bacterium]|jgi:hypothetical protein|nr:hypothetical protein [Candidatus Neomarinimicrobiota bacterium]
MMKKKHWHILTFIPIIFLGSLFILLGTQWITTLIGLTIILFTIQTRLGSPITCGMVHLLILALLITLTIDGDSLFFFSWALPLFWMVLVVSVFSGFQLNRHDG